MSMASVATCPSVSSREQRSLRGSCSRERLTRAYQLLKRLSQHVTINPLPAPGIVVGAVHGRLSTRAAARGAPGAAW